MKSGKNRKFKLFDLYFCRIGMWNPNQEGVVGRAGGKGLNS